MPHSMVLCILNCLCLNRSLYEVLLSTTTRIIAAAVYTMASIYQCCLPQNAICSLLVKWRHMSDVASEKHFRGEPLKFQFKGFTFTTVHLLSYLIVKLDFCEISCRLHYEYCMCHLWGFRYTWHLHLFTVNNRTLNQGGELLSVFR